MNETHFQLELNRAEKNGVTDPLTKNSRHAIQFPKKSDAVRFAKSIGWSASSPLRVEIMGFYVWVLSDDHLSFLTARGALRQLNDRRAGVVVAAA